MSLAELRTAVLRSDRFASALVEIAIRGVLSDLTAITPAAEQRVVDWSHALSCASVLTSDEAGRGQVAALRVAQGCLTSPDADEHHREAAAVLLERMGNRPAIHLAEQRDLVAPEVWSVVPLRLQLEVIYRRLELSIPLSTGETVAANRFQRAFWTLASTFQWLSVSAPTSAGKSFIVKRWFEERMEGASSFRGVYLVPTRALIDEVATDLREHFVNGGVGIHTIPWDADIGTFDREIHVLTQERLHLLHQRLADFSADLLFVDEAQKFGDGSRGVLLQRVLADAIERNAGVQVLFASPLALNPELLLEHSPKGADGRSLVSEMATVNQNLLWADQVPRRPREWEIKIVLDGVPHSVGGFTLAARPQPVSQRLPLVAVALAGDQPGNVVYVNRPSDAEKAAMQIYDALGDTADVSDNPRIVELRELIEKTVHRHYALVRVLGRGVAFHYGNMPLLLRAEIERLFRDGLLRYLVCTSTLLEGVNLPCRNLFVRGPKKGNGIIMSPPDFWNLAGRAGRWGKEFQGNIVCVDASNDALWPELPRVRVREPLKRATDTVLEHPLALEEYIREGAPAERARAEPLLESVYSFLATRVAGGVPLESLPSHAGIDADELRRVEEEIRAVLAGVAVPSSVMQRHAGISPPAMQRLLTYFREYEDVDKLLVANPESSDAAQTYVGALGRATAQLGANFGTPARQYMVAILIRDWMRGYPLARLIEARVQRNQDAVVPARLASIIRQTMQDVEQVARFEAPKYLACYLDLLKLHLAEIGKPELAAEMPDLNMMLELGVSRGTEVSLMSLGLSRTSTIAVSEFIVEDDLPPEEALAWLRREDLESLDIPALVREEIARARERNSS